MRTACSRTPRSTRLWVTSAIATLAIGSVMRPRQTRNVAVEERTRMDAHSTKKRVRKMARSDNPRGRTVPMAAPVSATAVVRRSCK
jgi:hypothetical protein